MRMDDVLEQLTPEHFADERIPSRSTMSERLAGIGLRDDFVQAIADICSKNAADRAQLLAQAETARQSASRAASDTEVGSSAVEAELVIVQQRSIAVSDKLVRAMERAAQLERERNDANQMVLVLLAMVDKLRRDTDTLTRERDRLRASRSVHTELEQVHEQLARSEHQRVTAETELERARAERQKADQLAEEAAEQVRLLTEELERLRGEVPDPDADHSAQLPTAAPDLQDALNSAADDIDLALVKAARHLDDRADRLDQLASELHLDNHPDNLPASTDAPDNLSDNALIPREEDATLTPEEVFTNVRSMVNNGEDQTRAESLLRRAGRGLSVADAMRTAALLQGHGLTSQATQLIFDAAANTPASDMPALVSGLRSLERDAELYQILNQVARTWPASAIVDAVTCLRDAEQHSDAYQVLSAVGRDCPPVEVLKVLARVDERDAQWVLDAACRDRSLDELPPLAEALQRFRRADAKTVERAHRQREETAAREAALTPRPRPARLLTNDGEQETSEVSDEKFVRPYAMAGGDAARSHVLPLDTVVRTTAHASQLTGQLPEHQRVCRLCREPHDISQIAQQLSIPLGVARILVADLLESGLLAVQSASALARLGRGHSIALTTETSRATLVVGLGWEVPDGNGSDFELDASAIGTKGGKVYSAPYFVFFNNLRAPDNSIVHTGQDAGADGDQQTILVNLTALPPDIDRIVFPVSIYDAETRGQDFSQVRNAYIRIATPLGQELARYNISEETAAETAVIAGELYLYRGKWRFRAIGQGYASGLRGIAMDFGVNV
jgi:stress response protein SCP2